MKDESGGRSGLVFGGEGFGPWSAADLAPHEIPRIDALSRPAGRGVVTPPAKHQGGGPGPSPRSGEGWKGSLPEYIRDSERNLLSALPSHGAPRVRGATRRRIVDLLETTRRATPSWLTRGEASQAHPASEARPAAPPLPARYEALIAPPKGHGARVVDARVDAFYVHARVEFGDAAKKALTEALETATAHGMAPCRIPSNRGVLAGQVKPVRSGGGRKGLFQCRQFRAVFTLPLPPKDRDNPEPPEWNIEFQWESEGLRAAGLFQLAAWTWSALEQLSGADTKRDAPIARGKRPVMPGRLLQSDNLGRIHEWRTTRVDVCADVAGWDFEDGETRKLVTRAKTFALYLEDYFHAEDRHTRMASAEYQSAKDCIGWVVSPGNAVLVRSYRKDFQARKALSADACAELYETWAEAGWKVGDVVRRVEIQARSEFLDELSEIRINCRDPEKIADVAEVVWDYVMSRWIRMRVDGRTRAERCKKDERWALLDAVRFKTWDLARVPTPARRRIRNGAKAEQTLGCVLSTLGVAGRLKSLLLTEDIWALKADSDAAEDFIRDRLRALFIDASDEVATRLLERRNARALVDRIMTLVDARVARFADFSPPERVPAAITESLRRAVQEHRHELLERLAA